MPVMIQDLVTKLNSLNKSSNEYGVLVKRLQDIRDYIDRALPKKEKVNGKEKLGITHTRA